MKTRELLLGGIGYQMTEIDNRLIFDEVGGMCGIINRFTIEWTGCGWYFVDLDSKFGRVRLSHIVAAKKWIEENYTINYNNGVGIPTLN